MAGGIQVPRLNRFEPTNAQGGDRYKVNTPEFEKGVEKQTRAATQFAEAATQHVQRVENEAADTEAMNRVNQFSEFYRRRLCGSPDGKEIGIKFQDGDPTALYKQFDDDMVAEFERLTTDESLQGKARELTLKRLTEKHNQLELDKLAEYGYQQAKYEDGVTAAAIYNEKNAVMDASAHIRPGEESTFGPVDLAIGRIRDLRLRSSLKTGGVVPDDENGNAMMMDNDGKLKRVRISGTTELALKKDISEAVGFSIDNALKSGNTDVARALQAKYGNYLDTQTKNKLADNFERADMDDLAYQAARNPKILAKISDPVKRDKVRDAAMKINDDRERIHENNVQRLTTRSYQTLANHLMSVQSSENPYITLTQLREDPQYKHLIDHIRDPRKREAIENMVVQPKNSNGEALAKMQNLFAMETDSEGRTVRDMSFEEFAEHLPGLSKGDQTYFKRKYDRYHSETGAEEASKMHRANKLFKESLIGMDVLTEDDFNRVSGEEFDKIVEWRGQLYQTIDALGPNPGAVEVEKAVESLALQKVRGEKFQAPARKKTVAFQGAIPLPKKEKPSQGKLIKGKTTAQWEAEFEQRMGRKPKTDSELSKFMLDNGD